MPPRYLVRCRSCWRIVLHHVPRIGERESDALASHLKDCRPDVVAPDDRRFWTELGPLLTHFDVTESR